MSGLLIVGAGVMGSVVGHWAQQHGVDVTFFDDGRPGAGSVPSAGMILQQWSPLAEAEHVRALHILDALYGLRSVRFDPTHIGLFVSPRLFLPDFAAVVRATVTKIGAGWLVANNPETGYRTYAGKVLVASGCWAAELWEKAASVRALAGTAFIWPKSQSDEPSLREWAPYKQVMSFERDPGKWWAGDGTSILRKNYTDARRLQSAARCAAPDAVQQITGYRPYVQGQKRGVCTQIMSGTWLLTGGGKSSTILAAHYAQQLLKEFKL